MTLACHCRGCQRLTSSAYSVSGVFAREAFELTAGQPVIGALRGEVEHWYCDSCKSWIYTVPPGETPVVNVRLTLLDDPPRGRPHVEMCTNEAQDWALLGSAHQYAGFPPPEDYPALARSFAGRSD
ncbi:GFA family protein [uncultured Erythrobacter sp.]|uniref:GFA family protein n=1 Tax=uncultured Erythrobacter sp. TaxID=263913 RepID=UPI00262D58E5|nr:GFA family protein [uncultured Erythrobacter sp.]